jgi:hypothetical protein
MEGVLAHAFSGDDEEDLPCPGVDKLLRLGEGFQAGGAIAVDRMCWDALGEAGSQGNDPREIGFPRGLPDTTGNHMVNPPGVNPGTCKELLEGLDAQVGCGLSGEVGTEFTEGGPYPVDDV